MLRKIDHVVDFSVVADVVTDKYAPGFGKPTKYWNS
jgi:hypothetical protein